MKKLLFGSMLVLLFILSACGGEEATKVKEEKKASAAETTSVSELEEMDWENMTEEDWDKVNLSKKDFKKLLDAMSEPDEDGEIAISSAKLSNDDTIEVEFNNSDGDTLENGMTAAIMDAFFRQFYKHSVYYNEKEPTIVFTDLTGFTIMENDKPIEYDEENASSDGEDLGEFKLDEKVDVAGTIITLSNPAYTDERNEYEEEPAEVLSFDVAVQNATDEDLYFDTYDFQVYDADGTLMETYALDYLTADIKPGKNTSGKGFYAVSGKGPYEVYYTDFVTDATAKWTIEVK
ncbi:DUF4352 domain-containing protein [Terribacillus saccharophilus]|uniref:DUF4352 domain-containing protein n=1 Tax=Terribacillus saccharophilus TaxID=361277 RepID=A0ABX4GUV2_9BACI|nr:DUF4352 domain-containing protein [Terribacillus saccharophilus]PAD34324.1 hypothetical protein CHH56_15040 [Terribacillus saccharophilus]PAD94902.1 hypothetical protein CHH50_16130 [Terribacillus saccharophilus]PAD98651.1 hypothetical protein CHH48_16140 [Terribacillus saccharophilus]